MESRAALGAAAALALTVTGGVSALFLAVGQASGAETSPVDADTAVTVEYVDQYGNPVAPAIAEAGTTNPEVILVNPDGTIVDPAMVAAGGAAYEGEAYEEEEYEEEEDEEGDEYEAEEYEEEEDDEYEEEEEYAGGHIEDEDHDEQEEYEDD